MRLLPIIVLAAVLATPVRAVDFSDPKSVVEALYEPYLQPEDQFDMGRLDDAPYISERLSGLHEADRREAGDEIGRIDFDPYVNGQDFELKDLVVGAPLIAGGKALVPVTFSNFGTVQDMGFLLVREDGGWKIDDVWNASADYSYDLLDILQAPLNR